MSTSRGILSHLQERNNAIREALTEIFSDNIKGKITLTEETINLEFKDSAVFRAAITALKTQANLEAISLSANNLQIKATPELIAQLKSADTLEQIKNDFIEAYLNITRSYIESTIKSYNESYSNLSPEQKEDLKAIKNAAPTIKDIFQMQMLLAQLNEKTKEIKQTNHSIEETRTSSHSSSEYSRSSRSQSVSDLSDEERESKYDDEYKTPMDDSIFDEQPLKQPESNYDTEIQAMIKIQNDPKSRQAYMKSCMEEEKSTAVKFVDYFHENKPIGQVSEKDQMRLDELLAKKLQAEEDAPKSRMK